MANLHNLWGTAELKNHKLLDSDGYVQEFEYPSGSITIDLKELRYRIDGENMATKDWQEVKV